jgi:hypothetical protein
MIAERLRALAEDNPGRLAIVDGEERITYGQLLRRIDSSREWLRQRLHIAPGDVILGSLENSWQFVACFFAIAESGGVFMPLHPGWRAPELRGFCERLKDPRRHHRTRVAPGVGSGGLQHASARNRRWIWRSSPLLAGARSRREQPRALSGDVRFHRYAAHRSPQPSEPAGRSPQCRPGSRHRSRPALPVRGSFYHSSGFHNSLILPLLNGACLILVRHFTPAACARLVAAERADVLIGSPFIYRMLLDHAQYLPTLNLCVSAGARMPQTLALAWQERFGTRVRQLYGSTETSVISIDRSAEPPPTGTVGTPIDEVEIRILNEGEVAVRSPMVMSGYVADPEWNLRVFEDGFFRTGDLGCLDSDGRLRLLGRTRRMINMAGVKVDPVGNRAGGRVARRRRGVPCRCGQRRSRERTDSGADRVAGRCRNDQIACDRALPAPAGRIQTAARNRICRSSAGHAGRQNILSLERWRPRPLIVADLTTMPMHTQIPVPEAWLNLAALLPSPLPIARSSDGQTVSFDGLAKIYSEECARIELLDGPYGADAWIPIPEEVAREYAKYRPTPVHRARGLEKAIGYAGAIYFKREDLSPTGSHKPNTAIPQAYYARKQGLAELITDTGAGQWGCALGWSCHNLGVRCTVFMTRNSYSAKPYRRYLMQLAGATVIASPSPFTKRGRALFEQDPGIPARSALA